MENLDKYSKKELGKYDFYYSNGEFIKVPIRQGCMKCFKNTL